MKKAWGGRSPSPTLCLSLGPVVCCGFKNYLLLLRKVTLPVGQKTLVIADARLETKSAVPSLLLTEAARAWEKQRDVASDMGIYLEDPESFETEALFEQAEAIADDYQQASFDSKLGFTREMDRYEKVERGMETKRICPPTHCISNWF